MKTPLNNPFNQNGFQNINQYPFKDFLYKIFILGKNAMPILINQNYDAAKSINFFKVENNYIIKSLIKFKLIISLLELIIKLIIFVENKLYIKNLYFFN